MVTSLAYGHRFTTFSCHPELSGLILCSRPHVRLHLWSYEGRAHLTASEPSVVKTFWSFWNYCTSAFNRWQTPVTDSTREVLYYVCTSERAANTFTSEVLRKLCPWGSSRESAYWEVKAVQGKAGKPRVTGSKAGAFRFRIVGSVHALYVRVLCACALCTCVLCARALWDGRSWGWWAHRLDLRVSSCMKVQRSEYRPLMFNRRILCPNYSDQ